ncbi:MAG TPA: PAS domain S-box protein [Longimicrobium sp.]|jgi:PAS domain S-box-containing protein
MSASSFRGGDERLDVLRRLGIPGLPGDGLDRFTRLAVRVLEVRDAFVAVVQPEGDFLISHSGWGDALTFRQLSSSSFLRHAAQSAAPLVVGDAREHPSYREAAAAEPSCGVAWLGIPLAGPDGSALGCFCVADHRPRAWTEGEVAAAGELAAAVQLEIARHRESAEQARAAEEARRELELGRAVTECAGTLVAAIDRIGRVVRFNRACELATGYTAAEVLGQHYAVFLSPDQEEEVHRALLAAGEGGRPYVAELDWLTRDGRRRRIAWSCTALRDGHGRVERFIAAGTDVTEQRRAEEALRESTEMLHALFAASPLAIQVLDPDGAVSMWNPASERMFGWKAEEVAGRPNPVVPPGAREEHRRLRERVLRGESFAGVEVERQTRTGARIGVRLSTAALHDASGAVRGVMAVIEDVSAERRAAEALAESERRYRELFQQSRDGIFITNRDGSVVDINDAVLELTGYTREEFLRLNAADTYADPADRERLREALERDGAVKDFAVRVRRRDGSELDAVYSATLRRDADGQVVGFQGIVHDVSEQVRIRRESEQAAAEARLNLARLEAVLDVLPVGVFITDPHGEVRMTNPAALAIWGGHTPLVGIQSYGEYRAWRGDTGEAVGPEDWPIARAVRTGEPVLDEELLIQAFDGSRKVVLASGLLFRDEAGGVLGGIAVNMDITARRRAEQAVETSEAKFRSLIENGSDLITVLHGGLTIGYESPAVKRLLGYAPEERAGRVFSSFVHPDDEERMREHFQTVFRSPGVSVPHEFRLRRADGAYRWMEGVSTSLMGDPAVQGVVANSRDVTDRKAAEEVLRESRRMLATLLDNLPGMAYRCRNTPGWPMEFVSAGSLGLTGYPADRLVGAGGPWFADLVHPQDRAGLWENVQRAVAEGKPFQSEYRIRTASGEEKWVWEQGVGVVSAGGELVALEGLILDVTEEKRAKSTLQVYSAELERSNRELQDFAYIASHDLQEPLRKIQAFGDRLASRSGAELGETGRDFLARMQSAAHRMQTLIQDLLAYSRVTSQARPLVPVRLEPLAREVVGDLQARVDETGGRVEIGELPELEADPVQMRQLLQNLVGNALKFHRDGVPPVVRLRGTLAGDGTAEIRVSDNGIGFDVRYLDRIFSPFERLHGRGEYEGTGMGLAICRKIVERHGGRVTAESTPGEGTTFIVSLPVQQRQERK